MEKRLLTGAERGVKEASSGVKTKMRSGNSRTCSRSSSFSISNLRPRSSVKWNVLNHGGFSTHFITSAHLKIVEKLVHE